MKPTFDDIINATFLGNSEQLIQYKQKNADFLEINHHGDSLLDSIVGELVMNKKPYRYQIIKLLIELGANPNQVSNDGFHAILAPIFQEDHEMIKVFLEGGFNPNILIEDEYDTPLGIAIAEYCYNTFYWIEKLVPPISELEHNNTDSLIAYLDYHANQNNIARPKHIILLREYGAKTLKDLNKTSS